MQRRMITVSQRRGVVGNVNAALLCRRTSGLLWCTVWIATLHWGSFFSGSCYSARLFLLIMVGVTVRRRVQRSETVRVRTTLTLSSHQVCNRSPPVLLAHLGSDGIYFYLLVLFRTHCTLPYLHGVHKFSSEMHVDRSLHSCILVLVLLLTMRESAPIMRKKRSTDARYPL